MAAYKSHQYLYSLAACMSLTARIKNNRYLVTLSSSSARTRSSFCTIRNFQSVSKREEAYDHIVVVGRGSSLNMKVFRFDRLRSKRHFVQIGRTWRAHSNFNGIFLYEWLAMITKLRQATIRQRPGPRRLNDELIVSPWSFRGSLV